MTLQSFFVDGANKKKKGGGSKKPVPRRRPSGSLQAVLRAEMGGARNVRMQLRSPGFLEPLKCDPHRFLWWLYDAGVPSSLPGGVYPIRRILGHPARMFWQKRREAGSVASEDAEDGGKAGAKGAAGGGSASEKEAAAGAAFYEQHALTARRCRHDPRPLIAALLARGDSAQVRRALLAVVNGVFTRLGWWTLGSTLQLKWLCVVAIDQELEMPHEHLAPAAVLASRVADAWKLRGAVSARGLVAAAGAVGNAEVCVERVGRGAVRLSCAPRREAGRLLADVSALAAAPPPGPRPRRRWPWRRRHVSPPSSARPSRSCTGPGSRS